MEEVGPSYTYYETYRWLRGKIMEFAPEGLSIQVGKTRQYGLPDFRLSWRGIRTVGLFPRPKGVELLLEFDKILENRKWHDSRKVDRLEDAVGALITYQNRLLVIQSKDDMDEEYIDTFLSVGMALYLDEIKRRHPD